MWLYTSSCTRFSITTRNNSGTGLARSYQPTRNTERGFENMDAICWRKPELFKDEVEPDLRLGCLVSNGIHCYVWILPSACIFERGRDRYHKKCASRTNFREGFQQIAT